MSAAGTRPVRARRWIRSFFAFALLATSTAHAQPPEDEAAQARIHGAHLLEEGRYEEALAELSRAYALSPSLTTLYRIGLAHAALGHAVEAADALERYLFEGGRRSDRAHRRRAEDELAQQRARIGTLDVEVNVEGAVVMLDGRELGRAPLTQLSRASAGTHSVAAEAPGYPRVERSVSLEGGQHLDVSLTLEPAASNGLLRIVTGVSDVAVTVDGDAVGTTPFHRTLALEPGIHRVHAVREGYRAFDLDVHVHPGRVRELELGMDIDPHAELGHLRLVVPADYDLRIDGRATPANADGWVLPAGAHSLVVDAAARQRWTSTVEITPGERTVIAPPLSWTPGARAAHIEAAVHVQTLGWIGISMGTVLTAVSVPLIVWNAAASDGWSQQQQLYLECAHASTCADGSGGTIDRNALRDEVQATRSRIDTVWWAAGISAGAAVISLLLGVWGLAASPSEADIDHAAAGHLSLGPNGLYGTF